MTAEIVILNKTAVALAADSAVTIGAGSESEKVFDTADKLFELSVVNPIGIMIYNGMSFAEAPLPTLIRDFRRRYVVFGSVQSAGEAFLRFLHEFGRRSPRNIQEQNFTRIIFDVMNEVQRRFGNGVQKFISAANDFKDMNNQFRRILDETLDDFISVFEEQDDAEFIGTEEKDFGSHQLQARIERLPFMSMADEEQKEKVRHLCSLIVRKSLLSSGRTGIIVAGFGADDLFPTLVSYEIDGMVQGRLKYKSQHLVDIDRNGTRARVLPFAQKEMVERFLYGLDADIERKIDTFCEIAISEIRKEVLKTASALSPGLKLKLRKAVRNAELAFLDGLRTRAFEGIRKRSQEDIEDMVEFMPKPEMAKMAEALVNLTSLKRRVTRGMETVGGPIDVAVISQSEGFVWVKRKHYFPLDINPRYEERVRASYLAQTEETGDGAGVQPSGSRKPRRAPPKRGRQRERDTEGA